LSSHVIAVMIQTVAAFEHFADMQFSVSVRMQFALSALPRRMMYDDAIGHDYDNTQFALWWWFVCFSVKKRQRVLKTNPKGVKILFQRFQPLHVMIGQSNTFET
jgi:hypothetical protein